MTKREYLELAKKVIRETQSYLTAYQIWEEAINKGYVTNASFGAKPWLTLAILISSDINKRKSKTKFIRTQNRPMQFCLKAVVDKYRSFPPETERKTERESRAYENRIRSGELTIEDLLARIKQRKTTFPKEKENTLMVIERDPRVRAYVRLRAEHKCELCHWQGFDTDDGVPYIEVHHLKLLADKGEDTPENAAALCPNCHRMLHFGAMRQEALFQLIEILRTKGVQVALQ